MSQSVAGGILDAMSATITNAAMVLFPERQAHEIVQAPEGGGTRIGAHHDEVRLIPEQDAAGAAPKHLAEEHLLHPDRFFVSVCAILLNHRYHLDFLPSAAALTALSP